MEKAIEIWKELFNYDELINDFEFNSKVFNESFSRGIDPLNNYNLYNYVNG